MTTFVFFLSNFIITQFYYFHPSVPNIKPFPTLERNSQSYLTLLVGQPLFTPQPKNLKSQKYLKLCTFGVDLGVLQLAPCPSLLKTKSRSHAFGDQLECTLEQIISSTPLSLELQWKEMTGVRYLALFWIQLLLFVVDFCSNIDGTYTFAITATNTPSPSKAGCSNGNGAGVIYGIAQ